MMVDSSEANCWLLAVDRVRGEEAAMEAVLGLVGLLLLAAIVTFPIYVLSRLAELGREVKRLREVVAQLLSAAPRARPEPRPPAIPTPPEPRPVTPAAPAPPKPAPRELPPPLPAAEAAPAPAPAAAAPPRAAQAPPPTRRDFESVLAANWLTKLGVAALAVAAAFFLKHAFDQQWIVPTARVAIGLIASGAMIALGQVLLPRPRYRAYAAVVTAGGIVVFFLSVYAAFNFYTIIPFPVAFALFAVGALAASALAAASNMESVALLALLGAFATPLLIRKGGPGPSDLLQLYAYLAVLDVWSAVLVRYRPWYSLTVVSLGATWLIFFATGTKPGADYLARELFAVIFLILACYGGWTSLPAPEERARDRETTGLTLILMGCVAFAIASALILAGVLMLGLPAFAMVGLVVALALAAMGSALPKLSELDRAARQLFRYLSAVALVMLMGACLTLGRHPASSAEAALGFAFGVFAFLLFLGVAAHMSRQEGGDGPAAALTAANAIAHMVVSFHVLATVHIWEIPAAPLWLPLAGWIGTGALWLVDKQARHGRAFPVALMVSAQALPLVAFLGAIDTAFRWAPSGAAAALFLGEFVLVSATWLAARRLTRLPAFRGDLLGAFGNAAVFFGLLAAAARMQAYQGFVVLCGCAIALAAYHAAVGGLVLRRPQDDALQRYVYLGLALTFLTIAVPLQLKASYLTLAWATEAAVLVWTGVAAGERRMRWYGVALLSITALKALLHDLTIAPAPFRLLLNTRMLSGASVIAAGYLAAWLLWRAREKLSAAERAVPPTLLVVANVFTLLFASLDLWDYVGKSGPAAARANAQQLALSIFWSIYALAAMSVGIWRRSRPVRLFALGLLYLAIGKVFLYDLSFLSQLYRIVSLFGLGVILLLVSLIYLRFEERLR